MAEILEITDVNELYNHINMDELFQWIVDYFSEEIVKDIVDSEPIYNSIDEDMVNKFCKKYIKQAVDSFLKSNNIDVKCTEQVYDEVCREYSESQYGAGIVNESKRKLRPSATFSLALINTDDNIGDVTDLRDTIDFGNRDGNFIIIGDKLIIGNYNATHSELINKYIKECLHNDTNKDLNDYMVRDLEEFDGISNDEPVVFGHIVNDMAFIETCIGYTANDAVNILKNQGNFKKIYNYDSVNNRATRLAKKDIRYCDVKKIAEIAEATNMYDLYDYIHHMDELFQWISNSIAETVIKDILDSKLDYKFINRNTVNKFCKKYIKQAVDSFLKNNNIDVECMEKAYDEVLDCYSESYYGSQIIERVKEESLKNATFAYDLIDTDDNIGDVTDLKDEIDLGNRDGNFIIIGDKLIIGDSYTTHSQLINEYIEDFLNKDINVNLNDYRVRNLKKFDGLSDDEPVVFGHIVDDMAFIETCIGYTVNDAVNILKNQGSFKKIYDYNHDNDEVTRLAKKVIPIGNRYT